MTKANPKTHEFPAPRWMTRTEKLEFKRLNSIRKAAGNPIMETDVIPICDLVSARSRVTALRGLFKRAMVACRDSDFESSQRHLLAIARDIDRATAAAQKMASKLGI
ncbi:hypothetical protein NKJ86_14150 [Mesorhizobium sp. M0025]|uniref:hypothetical protein n=1 Tax=Mesorhizobium sp. M0025 TaxID=2956846 RepID=UPI0033369D5B